MNRRNKPMKRLLFPLMFGACWGCSDHEEQHADEVDPEAAICEHVGDRPTVIDATADSTSAPTLAPDPTPYEVTLQDVQGVYHGFLRIEGPAGVLLFLGQAAVAGALTQGASGPDVLPPPAPNDFCPAQLPEHFDLELEGGEYYLELGPSSLQTVLVALVEATGHAHE
jgi:hypothetical protein